MKDWCEKSFPTKEFWIKNVLCIPKLRRSCRTIIWQNNYIPVPWSFSEELWNNNPSFARSEEDPGRLLFRRSLVVYVYVQSLKPTKARILHEQQRAVHDDGFSFGYGAAFGTRPTVGPQVAKINCSKMPNEKRRWLSMGGIAQ